MKILPMTQLPSYKVLRREFYYLLATPGLPLGSSEAYQPARRAPQLSTQKQIPSQPLLPFFARIVIRFLSNPHLDTATERMIR